MRNPRITSARHGFAAACLLLALSVANTPLYAQTPYLIIPIAKEGQGPTGTYVDFGFPSISESGRVAFSATVDYGTDGTETVIFRHNGFTPTDAEPLFSSALPSAGSCANSGGAICLNAALGRTVLVNDSDNVAFSVSDGGQFGRATDIVAGDGFAVPGTVMSNAEADADSFEFSDVDPLSLGDFNNNGFAGAGMATNCSNASGGRSLIGNGSLIPGDTIGQPSSNIPPGLLIGEPCDVAFPDIVAGAPLALATANQTVVLYGRDPTQSDMQTSPSGDGLYLSRPRVSPGVTRLAPLYDGQTFMFHLDVNSSGIAVYTDNLGATQPNLRDKQPLYTIDVNNPGAGPTELLAAGFDHPDFSRIDDLAITDSGEIYALVDPKFGNFAIYKIDATTGSYEQVGLLNRQIGDSTIFRVNWARGGVNSRGEIAARIQLFSGEWMIIKAIPESLVPQIQVYDPDPPIADRTTYIAPPSPANPAPQAIFRIENGSGGNLTINGVGVDDPLAAPFAISQDDCTGQTLNSTDAVPENDSCEITVTFSPSVEGEFSDTFDILSNDPAEPSITLTVTGGEAAGPGDFAVEQATYSIGEGDGNLTVNVVRRNGSAGAVTVDFASQDQEALGGADYTAVSGTLEFAEGESVQPITIPIIDDTDIESAETFLVALSNPTGGATLGTPASTTVTINDNDVPQPDLNISGVAEARSEPAGNGASEPFIDYAITVSNEGLAGASNVVVTLDYDPAQLAWDSDDSSGAYDVTASTWSIGNLPLGDSQTLLVTFRALAEATIELTATASTDSAEPDPDPNPNVITFSTSIGPDSDGDGIFDVDDNAPNDFNPDQSDIDDDGTGDVADICPGDATDSCDPDRSTARNVDGNGGTLETADGAVSIDIPAGALGDDTSMSITDLGSGFELATDLGTTEAVFGVNIGPDGTVFATPITIVMTWPDTDDDGTVDETSIDETSLQVFKDGVAISDTCDIDAGCDPAANTFTVEVTSLSDFVIGAVEATPPPPPPPPAGSGSGSSNCFIATAAYGSFLEPEVMTLRHFRDRWLLTNAPGRAFVNWYYRTSPAIADTIAANGTLRLAVRAALTPIVYAIKHPGVTLGLLLIGFVRLRWARLARGSIAA